MNLPIKPVLSIYCYNLYSNCSRNNIIQRQTVLLLSRKCFYHKYKPNMAEKQSRLLARFNSEIEETMIKLNKNYKNKNKQKLIANILRAKPVVINDGNSNISTGSPNQLMVRKDGMSKTFLTTRMKILNTNFMRAISEIFMTDEEISKQIENLEISLTQVRVSSNHKTLNVYWYTNNSEADKKQIAEYLNSICGRLHELLIENQFLNSVPWINFVYDLQTSYYQEVESRLSRCKSNETINTNNNIGEHPDESASSIENYKLSDRINFEEPFEEISDDYNLKLKYSDYNPEDTYRYLKLRLPEDMKLNVFEFDYEFLMNKVLQNMHRTRPKNSDPVNYLNALDHTLPPVNPLEMNNNAVNMVNYNTEERIQSMKKFVIQNRKKQDKAELRLKRMILQEESNRLESYDQLREALESRFEAIYDDLEPEQDNYRSDQFDNE